MMSSKKYMIKIKIYFKGTNTLNLEFQNKEIPDEIIQNKSKEDIIEYIKDLVFLKYQKHSIKAISVNLIESDSITYIIN